MNNICAKIQFFCNFEKTLENSNNFSNNFSDKMTKINIPISPLFGVLEDTFVDEKTAIGLETAVILFNDEWHTFDEVINQIRKAIGCTQSRAEELTHEVHFQGRSRIYSGEIAECLRISSILEEIALRTQIIC